MDNMSIGAIAKEPAFDVLKTGVLRHVSLNSANYAALYDWLLADGKGECPALPVLSTARIAKRNESLEQLTTKYHDVPDETWQQWLTYKQQETALLTAIHTVQTTGDVAPLTQLNAQLYGVLDVNLLYGCIGQVCDKIDTLQRDTALAAELFADLNLKRMQGEAVMHTPDVATFAYYKQLAHEYFGGALELLESTLDHAGGTISGTEVARLLEAMLVLYGADAAGWRVMLADRVDRISVSSGAKTIHVAKRDFHLSPGRLKGLLLHEVGVHVLRSMHKTGFEALVPAFLAADRRQEEGLGVLVEQLVLREYHSLRLFRYIALGLSTDTSQPRTALEVYGLLWKLRYLSNSSSLEQAKRFAALETLRVVRGIAPTVPGAVLLRDAVYVEGVDALWRRLSTERLSPDAFEKLLRGSEIT